MLVTLNSPLLLNMNDYPRNQYTSATLQIRNQRTMFSCAFSALSTLDHVTQP